MPVKVAADPRISIRRGRGTGTGSTCGDPHHPGRAPFAGGGAARHAVPRARDPRSRDEAPVRRAGRDGLLHRRLSGALPPSEGRRVPVPAPARALSRGAAVARSRSRPSIVAGAEKIRTLEQSARALSTGRRCRGGTFIAAVEAYAAFHWEHMRREEKEVIPLAEKHLTARRLGSDRRGVHRSRRSARRRVLRRGLSASSSGGS